MRKPVAHALTLAVAMLALAGCKERSQGNRTPTQMPPILASLSAAPSTTAPLTQKDQSMFTPLANNIDVAPQISLDQVAAAKAQGVTMIINNRPDGEDPSAPQGADIAAAAEAAGLDYVAIPITHAGFSGPQVDAMIAAMGKAEASGGKVLAYCRSGTRSTLLWSLAKAKQGGNPAELSKLAANAGYDLSPIRPMLDALSGRVE
ncbi:TIGR01244 family sulfur transferase [Blastomonas aquatica]|uniref:Beta-lactamase hydrolase-like protein phosphatase-like domain-containing protein n=1 Tax=Blastomonas aquatica TaxID=1510276 RepID=A0ABQ1IWU6_9SPHN|nr:TIGR01244 family sulfur transferase [Blastomonas aquatica]GGB53896.1 hypothetical protein GCM10010833_05680 [Blastomonas aquatica]